MAKRDFEPIKITGYNEEKVGREGNKNFRIPFSLTSKPPCEWEQSFNQLWRSRAKENSSQKAKAYLKKNLLVLVSPLTDVSLHFANLKADVEAANKQYLEHLQQKNEKISEKKRQREEKLLAERQALRDVLEGLPFTDS